MHTQKNDTLENLNLDVCIPIIRKFSTVISPFSFSFKMTNEWSEAVPLAVLLCALIKALSPGPTHFSTDLPYFNIGSSSLSVAKVACALLKLSFDEQAVAQHLWKKIREESRSKPNLRFFAWSFEVY